MNKSVSIMLSVIAVLIVVAGLFIFSTPRANAPKSETTTNSQQKVLSATSSFAPMTATVEYSSVGFSPRTVVIKEGGTVTFTSTDGSKMYVASNEHPTHMEYSDTSRSEHCPDTTGVAFDQCTAGSTYTFTFLNAGKWGYHNHLNPGATGMVIALP